MTTYRYSTTTPIGTRGILGLIALQADETIEQDMRQMFPDPDVAVYVSRVPSDPQVRQDTLAQMDAALTGAAALFPQSLEFDIVGYGCTSGTSVIGAAAVASRVHAGCRTRQGTQPVSALQAACAVLGVQRLAFLSPYIADVSAALRRTLAEGGIECPAFGSFDEAEEARVARLDPADIFRAGRDLGQAGDTDALFLSCTNLRTLGVIEPLELELGKPVLSSNQVLAWHMAHEAGSPARIPGRLGKS